MTRKKENVEVDFRVFEAMRHFMESGNLKVDLEYTGVRLVA